MGKIYLARRNSGWYRYQDVYVDGKRIQKYYGKASWIESMAWRLLRRLKTWARRR